MICYHYNVVLSVLNCSFTKPFPWQITPGRMTLAGPGFRDFEDYQFLQSYDDFGDTHNLLDDHDVDYYLNSCLPMEAASNFGASIGFGDPFSGGTFNFDEYTPPFEMDTQDSGVEPMTFHRHEGFQSFNYANVQRDLYTPPPSSVASSDGGDVILNALLLAGRYY